MDATSDKWLVGKDEEEQRVLPVFSSFHELPSIKKFLPSFDLHNLQNPNNINPNDNLNEELFSGCYMADEDINERMQSLTQTLALAKKENEELRKTNEVLQEVFNDSTHMSSLLESKTHLHCSFLPSASVGQHPIEHTAWLVLETSWNGEAPKEEWLQVWLVMPMSFIIKLDIESKNRLENHATVWAGANGAIRQQKEKMIRSILKTRDALGNLLSRRSPGRLSEYYKTSLSPVEEAAKQHMRGLIEKLGITEEQRSKIKSVWAEHSNMMKVAAVRTEAAQLALTLAGQCFCSEGICENMKSEVEKASYLATYISDLNNNVMNSIIIYQRLVIDAANLMTWKQRVALVLGSRPYSPSWSHLCELLA